MSKQDKIFHIKGQVVNVKDADIALQKLFKTILKEEKNKQQQELLQKEVSNIQAVSATCQTQIQTACACMIV